jgi:hypothetical protein
MLLEVDLQSKADEVRLFLCKNNVERTTLAELHHIKDRKLTLNYGGIDQISFGVPHKIMRDGEMVDNSHMEKIRGDYLIRYEKGVKKVFFIITNIENSAEGKEERRVQCQSLQYEWKNKIVRGYAGTKKLHDSIGSDGVINETLMVKTDWSISYTDSSLDTKYRTFDESQRNLLEFVYYATERYGDVIPIVDTVNKQVSLYLDKNLGVDEGLEITHGKYLKSLTESENFDDVVTRLYCYGKDNISINSLNPSGQDYIESFDFYIHGFSRENNINYDKLKSGSLYANDTTNITDITQNSKTLGLNVVNVPVKIDITDSTSSDPTVNATSKSNAITLIQSLNTEGLKVILEPYPWIANGTVSETNYSPSDKALFFTNWKACLDELIVDIANPYSVYCLNTSSNLVNLEPETASWKDVFAHVKSQYTGQVTYRTNWWITATWDTGAGSTTEAYNNKLNNELFGDANLDFISIAAYFELNNDFAVPTVEQLKADLRSVSKFDRGQDVYQEVKNFYDTWGKPIFFGELGVPSVEYGASEPWNPDASTVQSQDVQSNVFQAYKETFIDDWFMGFSIFIVNLNSSNYYPIGKLAQKEVKQWFRDEEFNVLSKSVYMDNDLCMAIEDYNTLLTDRDGDFNGYLAEKENLQTTLTTKQNELATLETDLQIIEDDIDTAIANGDGLTLLNQQKADKEAEIQAKKDEIAVVNADIASVDAKIADLINVLKIEVNFTPEQIIERNTFVKEAVWQDNNYTNADDLYAEGKERLIRVSQPIVAYKVDAIDFTQALNTQKDWNKLKIGGIVTINYPNWNLSIKAKIITIDHDIDNNSIQLTIANHKDIKSGFLKIKDLLNRNVHSSVTQDMSKYKWDLSEQNNSTINQLINSEWDAAKQAVTGGVNENVTVDRRGITLKDPTDDLNFVRILHNIITLTSDGGNTYKNALTPSGLIAERVIGKLLVGESLTIGDVNGILEIVGNLLTIKDNNGVVRTLLGEYATGKYGLKLLDKTGNTTILDEDGILQTWQEGNVDNVDSSNPLVLNVFLPSDTRSVKKSILRFRLMPFRSYSQTSASGGGSTETTSSGGSLSTTTLSGGGTTKTSKASSLWDLFAISIPDAVSSEGSHTHGGQTSGVLGNTDPVPHHYHDFRYMDSAGSHGHSLTADHRHDVDIPSHSHDFSIPDHSHSVNIPSHTHSIVHGIYTSTSATSVTVKINGTDRTTALGGSFTTDQNNLDLTQYMVVGQWNTIELGSSRLGRIDATVFIQALMGV